LELIRLLFDILLLPLKPSSTMMVPHFIIYALCLIPGWFCLAQSQLPEPTGNYITGVQDFEFLDAEYPSEDASGRRLMARVWYPACPKANFELATGAVCVIDGGGGTALGRLRMF
jgi:hypothetical protein